MILSTLQDASYLQWGVDKMCTTQWKHTETLMLYCV